MPWNCLCSSKKSKKSKVKARDANDLCRRRRASESWNKFKYISLLISHIFVSFFPFSQYNENIKNHNVPESSEPEKKRKTKFYDNLRLDQCEKTPKTNSKLNARTRLRITFSAMRCARN